MEYVLLIVTEDNIIVTIADELMNVYWDDEERRDFDFMFRALDYYNELRKSGFEGGGCQITVEEISEIRRVALKEKEKVS